MAALGGGGSGGMRSSAAVVLKFAGSFTGRVRRTFLSDRIFETTFAISYDKLSDKNVRPHSPISPLHFHSKLELARIISSGGLARIGEKWAYGGNVVAVRDVEHVNDKFKAGALSDRNTFGDP